MAAPTHAEHHDETRAAVPTTALGVCRMRAWESKKPESERLIYDPFAAILCGSDSPDLPLMDEVGRTPDFWIDFIAARTRWIDEQVSCPVQQLAILGAGLDTRAYRLESLRGLPVFEVDFPEVLNAKAKLLDGHIPIAKLTSVTANLSLNAWDKELVSNGFQKVPTMWLLEGLLGYLTQAEVEALLGQLSQFVDADTKMTVTFVGAAILENVTSMHRYLVSGAEEIEALLQKFGWQCRVWSVGDIAHQYGRADHIPADYGYYLVSAWRA
mmetsp:Transcript_9081/g.16618  ORF Transcript_9081/g.16618 Transcript_9081/m.16618 type:complete len:269 (-) Transcript_9081:203-1009(-)